MTGQTHRSLFTFINIARANNEIITADVLDRENSNERPSRYQLWSEFNM